MRVDAAVGGAGVDVAHAGVVDVVAVVALVVDVGVVVGGVCVCVIPYSLIYALIVVGRGAHADSISEY